MLKKEHAFVCHVTKMRKAVNDYRKRKRNHNNAFTTPPPLKKVRTTVKNLMQRADNILDTAPFIAKLKCEVSNVEEQRLKHELSEELLDLEAMLLESKRQKKEAKSRFLTKSETLRAVDCLVDRAESFFKEYLADDMSEKRIEDINIDDVVKTLQSKCKSSDGANTGMCTFT